MMIALSPNNQKRSRWRSSRVFVLALLALICYSPRAKAQDESALSELQEDTTIVTRPKFVINNYSMIGVEYGVTRNSVMFNPKYAQTAGISPGYMGVTFTRYFKMFGYMPYFGLQVGAFYGQEGYQMKTNKDTGITPSLMGETKVTYKVLEVPLLMEAHADFTHFKILADIGPYAGYRLNVERIGEDLDEALRSDFGEFDNRFDYGLYAGVGFGLVFSPIEFHVKLRLRYSWSTLYEPNFSSDYYYKFVYPFDFMLTAGVHFQLTKRTGKTKAMLRREAYEAVYGTQ